MRHFLITFPTCRTDRYRSAKLWIPLHLRLYHDSHEYVGDSFRVRRSKMHSAIHWILTTAFRLQNVRFRSRKRRHGGPGLRLHWNRECLIVHDHTPEEFLVRNPGFSVYQHHALCPLAKRCHSSEDLRKQNYLLSLDGTDIIQTSCKVVWIWQKFQSPTLQL